MRKLIFLCISYFIYIYTGHSQIVKGKVFGEGIGDRMILPGASVNWLGENNYIYANDNGVFEIQGTNIQGKQLRISFNGYLSDTILITDKLYITVVLKANKEELAEYTKKAEEQSSFVSKKEYAKTEVITPKEMSKSACCDMAGCFETQATVQPQTTNVITNSKELRILGLSGVYNQVLVDGMPMIQGLSYTYGISSYPGSLIENIFVSKGANSVLQGYEGIAGQINLVTKTPEKSDAFFANIYINSFAEKHINFNYATLVGKKKKWGTILALHTAQPGNKFDRDRDLFLDLPQLTRYMIFNKWKFGNENRRGLFATINARFLNEDRVGGQTAFDRKIDLGSSKVYGQSVRLFQPDLSSKIGYRIDSFQSVVVNLSSFYQQQNSYFGTTHYQASQFNFYLNVQHELLWRKVHQLKYGVSFRWQDLKENIAFTVADSFRNYDGDYQTQLKIPGIFVENVFKWYHEKLTLITGVRLDRHQEFGYYLTPRGMLKLSPSTHHTVRVSLGKGWRQVNLISENNNILSSSRDIVFIEKLKPEGAYNWGMNYVYTLDRKNFAGTLSIDMYQTRFINQFFPDYDASPSKVDIKNFYGKSISNALQVDVSTKLFNYYEIKIGYNFLDVFRMVNNEKYLLPFNPKNRLMTAISIRPKKSKFLFDMNIHWYDKQRLPSTSANPTEYQSSTFSKAYTLVNFQLTYKAKRMEWYAGCENVFDFRQLKPIISWQFPFGKYFDTSSVWGPTRGREIYIGWRWKLKQ